MNHSYLLLPHIKIQNANALSSSLTVGFPAVTAFLGFAHLLERLLIQNGFDVHIPKLAICVHDFSLRWYKESQYDFYSFIVTANPLNKKGDRPSFIEEPRCYMDVSILLETSNSLSDDAIRFIQQTIKTLKLASGDVLDTGNAFYFPSETLSDKEFLRLKRKVMPGYWLLERSDLVREGMLRGLDAMQALLQVLKTTCTITKHNCEEEKNWKKTTPGWIIPIAVGYQGLTPCHYAINQRDVSKKHRFAESIVTLGEFKMAHRISSLNEILWRYQYLPKENLYLCKTKY